MSSLNSGPHLEPYSKHAADRFAALPRLPRDEGGAVFAEAWEAQAFALAVKLSEQGHFTWKEWSAALADELKALPNEMNPTMVRIITNTGWLRSSGSSSPRV
jgi:hypothetical protein